MSLDKKIKKILKVENCWIYYCVYELYFIDMYLNNKKMLNIPHDSNYFNFSIFCEIGLIQFYFQLFTLFRYMILLMTNNKVLYDLNCNVKIFSVTL